MTKTEPGKNHSYAYDDIYRLTQSSPTPLDPASNDMRAEGFTFAPLTANHRTGGPDNIETYLYGQDNQLTSLALATPLTSAEDFTYTYDYENRLTGVVKVVGGITTTVIFKYDPFGRRIQKHVSTTQNGQNVVKTYYYAYDREDVILERLSTSTGGVTTNTDTKYAHGPGLDEPLAVAKGNSVYYYHADGVGSIVALTNGTEATVEGYTYETFGKFQRYGNAVQNTYGFTGREYDEETGLYYYRARYYDPETGRFISKDPIGFAGGDANQYNYVLGDPVNFLDPLGLWYIDFNFSLAYWGGVTGGIIIGSEGIYTYGGGGVISPLGGIAITVSPLEPSPGWNIGLQSGYWAGFQYGYSLKDKNTFWELGFVTPGFGGTAYNVSEPWKWPWKKDNGKTCK